MTTVRRTLMLAATACFVLVSRAHEGMWLPTVLASVEDDMQAEGLTLTRRGHLQRQPRQHEGCRRALRRRLHRGGDQRRGPDPHQPPLRFQRHPAAQLAGERLLEERLLGHVDRGAS